MKKLSFILTLISLISFLNADWAWVRDLAATDMVRVWDLAVSYDYDAVWASGQFTGTMHFGQEEYPGKGEPDAFVAKYSLEGEELWFRSFGSPEEDVCFSVAAGYGVQGNTYFTGYFNGVMQEDDIELESAGLWDVFYGKLDTNGNLLWLKRFGGILNDIGYGIAVDYTDHFVITGWFADSIDFGNGITLASYGGSDMFVARFDPDGNCLWARHGGDIGVDYGFKVDVDGLGNAYCTGTAGAGALFDGLTQTYSGMYLAIYDTNGNILEHISAQHANPINIGVSKSMGGVPRAILTGRVTGSAIFGGASYSSYEDSDDIFIAKYTLGSGEWDEVQIIGGAGSDKGRAAYAHERYGWAVAASFEESFSYYGLLAEALGSWDCAIIREDNKDPLSYFGSCNTDVISALERWHDGWEFSGGWYSGTMQMGDYSLDSGSDAKQNGFVAGYLLEHWAAAEDAVAPYEYRLYNYPNPFVQNTTICLKNPKPGEREAYIYNLKGQKLKELKQGTKNAEELQWQWDGKDDSNRPLASGIYFLRLKTAEGVQNHKMLLVK